MTIDLKLKFFWFLGIMIQNSFANLWKGFGMPIDGCHCCNISAQETSADTHLYKNKSSIMYLDTFQTYHLILHKDTQFDKLELLHDCQTECESTFDRSNLLNFSWTHKFSLALEHFMHTSYYHSTSFTIANESTCSRARVRIAFQTESFSPRWGIQTSMHTFSFLDLVNLPARAAIVYSSVWNDTLKFVYVYAMVAFICAAFFLRRSPTTVTRTFFLFASLLFLTTGIFKAHNLVISAHPSLIPNLITSVILTIAVMECLPCVASFYMFRFSRTQPQKVGVLGVFLAVPCFLLGLGAYVAPTCLLVASVSGICKRINHRH